MSPDELANMKRKFPCHYSQNYVHWENDHKDDVKKRHGTNYTVSVNSRREYKSGSNS